MGKKKENQLASITLTYPPRGDRMSLWLCDSICMFGSFPVLFTKISMHLRKGLKNLSDNQESALVAVKEERRPAAWAGKISPNVDMAAADLSLNMPTWPSVNMDPNFRVLSPNLLPTWPDQSKQLSEKCVS